MINSLQSTLVLLSLFFAQSLIAQDNKAETKNDLVLVKVASLNTIDANKEFQKNVQLVQQQRALAAQTLTKLNSTTDEKVKVKLQKQFDALQDKLNENNQLMFKTYGFSLNRNYVLTVEKSHIHMWVTPEEAEAIKNKPSSVEPEAKEKEKTGFRSLFNRKK